MAELVTTECIDHYAIAEPNKIVRKDGKLYTMPQTKKYKMVYDKRILTEDLRTLPFGWCEQDDD